MDNCLVSLFVDKRLKWKFLDMKDIYKNYIRFEMYNINVNYGYMIFIRYCDKVIFRRRFIGMKKGVNEV